MKFNQGDCLYLHSFTTLPVPSSQQDTITCSLYVEILPYSQSTNLVFSTQITRTFFFFFSSPPVSRTRGFSYAIRGLMLRSDRKRQNSGRLHCCRIAAGSFARAIVDLFDVKNELVKDELTRQLVIGAKKKIKTTSTSTVSH